MFSGTGMPRDLTKYLPRIAPRPVFLINAEHNEVDAKASEYWAARAPKQRWLLPTGGHTDGIRVMPAEWSRSSTARCWIGGLPPAEPG